MSQSSGGEPCPAFPDEAHLRQLRSLLWADSGRGRASVMVGTGFSRNAVPLFGDRQPIPLWGDLAASMAAEVWPREQSRRSVDALVLAEYYERLHNRTSLDDFLRREIRDPEFLPGRLHVLLMALPWVDVFTTNYDTLLERASRQVVERRYTVVESQGDLSSARQPRIIKLNGSFPSHRPFIITQEDFRTYPVKFAAFVNTVQQAIMETAVCMIGFSGDDPNFQAWTGWVRDNLGSAAPPVYHCDTLDLDVARRSYYEARNIRPIDLGPLFPKEKWGQRRKSAALEWFILSLAEDAPVEMDAWPTVTRRKPALPMTELVSHHKQRDFHRGGRANTPRSAVAWDPSEGLPTLLEATVSEAGPKVNDGDTDKLIAHIKVLRATYPGWVLNPGDFILEHNVQHWYSTLSDAALRGRLDILELLAWGMEILNCPWPDEFLHQVEAVLDAAELGAAGEQAFALARRLIREARERDEPERFNRWMERLSDATRGNRLAVAEWWLEKAKYHLGRLELKDAENAVRCVSTQPSRPFLDVERAGLLFELGKPADASAVAAHAVDLLRGQTDPQAPPPRLIGQEASALDVAVCALLAEDLFECAVGGSGSTRRRELRKSGCDPRQQLEFMGAELLKEHPPERSLTKEFDPGMWTTTVRHGSKNPEARAHCYLRALEVSAQLPVNHRDHILAAANLVAAERPGRAFSHLVRAHASLDGAFSRERVAALPVEAVETLFDRCAHFIRTLLSSPGDYVPSPRATLRLAATKECVELLSRLTVRSTPERRRHCLELAIGLFQNHRLSSSVQMARHVRSVFERLLLAMPKEEQSEALLKLVKMDIPTTNEDSYAASQMPWDPAMFVQPLGDLLAPLAPTLREDVSRLAQTIRAGDEQARTAAVARLHALDEAGGLDPESRRIYVDALWSRVDEDTGLPLVPGFSPHLGLLACPGYEDAVQRFKEWAFRAPVPPLFSVREFQGEQLRAYEDHWVRQHMDALTLASRFPWSEGTRTSALIDWRADEAALLLAQMQSWLADIDDSALLPKTIMDERAIEVVDKVGGFVALVLVPRLNASEPSLTSTLAAIDDKLRRLGCRPLSHYPTWLRVDVSAGVSNLLRKELVSSDADSVRDALWLVTEWQDFSAQGLLSPPPQDLIDQVFLLTSLAPTRALSSAFGAAWRIYRRHPDALTDMRRGWVQLALDRLFSSENESVRAPDLNSEKDSSPGDLKASAARLLTGLAIRHPSDSHWTQLLTVAEGEAYPEVKRACEETRDALGAVLVPS